MGKLIAHRGWSGIAPENTISAIRLALEEEKIDAIELDVHLSSDGVPVVIHDYTLERTTNGIGNVKDYTVQQLKELDAGSWFNKNFKGEKIPTLEEVLQLVGIKKKLFIELKQMGSVYEGLEKKVTELLMKYNMADEATIISFDPYSLLRSKNAAENIQRTLVLFNMPLLLQEQLHVIGAQSISINSRCIDQHIVDNLIAADIQLIVWTVDDQEEAKRLLRITDEIMITTNHPERLW